ncbi:MAG: hypothetical protein A3B74_00590 [Candidatus Kerfeldbacteria bacterium RIFCSPHIGHO2_02_FULL_42_14]|uniref:Uncharacterized protein n=1 Tax=Candidatus Kerfeldbacteria bacterium RIFCSPHIGHO2_02_FULL_42_14 TaxID=1798540 RepID=A0A1G2AS24_9BACT|nr:MAG: hypothetical protein A3B74_00590 [Candidatus Kerfeldbacteria bacterium RIFCSPHIGHO2_02_FULL_42_14]OGY81462.1 MAG: hypothetical protein A3E60_05555 [Candidatus Kerfeldbacteria bacterium RIFCSPHIGHO2_12_FULL_42_13]OGY83509.1 MAG: hypothetical protein A3I91_02585 [Candidatus Kerfeldbacteria bacterium RIFCSPLOWO2_02_FULL_42_19]OGY86964.1 MAG: hypothetical protein A3G01_01620 [Candidatus Kerfeldbacteria bacterium RIFCSPLOWO2_12_FULL_43_9]
MSIISIVSNTLLAFFFSSLAIGMGMSLLRRLRFEHHYAVIVSVAYLIGLGILGNIGLLLGLIGQFKATVVYSIFGLLWIAFIKTITRECRRLWQTLWYWLRRALTQSKITAAVVLLMSVIVNE